MPRKYLSSKKSNTQNSSQTCSNSPDPPKDTKKYVPYPLRGFEIVVHYDGAFFFQPLRYDGGEVLSIITSPLKYDELHDYLEKETGHPFTDMYLLLEGNPLDGGLVRIQNDVDTDTIFELANTYDTKQVLYLDHLNLDLGDYIFKVDTKEGDVTDNEGGITDADNEEGDMATDADNEGDMANDADYEGDMDDSEDDDAKSAASLDHLSEGEDEVEEIRKGNPIANIPHPNQLPKLGVEKKPAGGEDVKPAFQHEHDEFMQELLKAMNGGEDVKEDPLKNVEVAEKFPIHDPLTHWKLKQPKLGERYEGPGQLKECLSYYALQNGFSIWYQRSEKKSIIARCGSRPPRIANPEKGKLRKFKRYPSRVKGDVPSCTFRCYARWMSAEKSFQIITLVDKHTCSRNFKYGSLIDYKWIGKHFSNRIRQNPNIRLVDIADLVMKKYKCFVSPGQCKRARAWALNEYEKSLVEHYGLLRSYGDAILRSNPGSTVQLGVSVNPDEKTYFERFYVCLFGLKEGWKLGCRRVIALDGCFLKHTCKGELLTVVGRDGNNHIFPVAWAVVSVENKENWTWFLELLGQDLDMPEGHGLTLISDQHKGLIEAVRDVMPHSEHRQCARHIYENFRKAFSGVEFRNMFWRASKATYPAWFNREMEAIKHANPNAHNYLVERNPKSWSRAFFELHRGCDAVENGFSECFNSVLVKVRHRPIITMLEAIRVIIMQRMETMRTISDGWTDELCPSIRKKLEWLKDHIRNWSVIHAGGNKFEVRNGDHSFTVDEGRRSCSCRVWELTGIPCTHAIAGIFYMHKRPEDYIPGWFRRENYQQAYTQFISPVDGMDTWEVDERNKPLPPIPRRMPGRPKQKRQRAAHEPMVRGNRVTKHGVEMTCSKCKQKGHNKLTCESDIMGSCEPKKKSTRNKKKSTVDKGKQPSCSNAATVDKGKQPSCSNAATVDKGKQVTPRKTVKKTVKQVTPRKRPPSERILKQKLGKRVGGHGSSLDDCMDVDD